MRRKKIFTTTVGSIVLLGSLALTTGCEERQGPMERAGEKIDRAVEDAKDAVNPPGPVEKAGRAVDRAVDDATK